MLNGLPIAPDAKWCLLACRCERVQRARPRGARRARCSLLEARGRVGRVVARPREGGMRHVLAPEAVLG